MSKFIPSINADSFRALMTTMTQAESQILGLVTRSGAIRATRPKAPKGADKATLDLYSDAAFVWRFAVFQVSKKSEHHCMPCLVFVSDAGLPEGVSYSPDNREANLVYIRAKRAKEKTLLALADKLVNCVDKAEWHGIARWRGAMTQVG